MAASRERASTSGSRAWGGIGIALWQPAKKPRLTASGRALVRGMGSPSEIKKRGVQERRRVISTGRWAQVEKKRSESR